MSWFRIIKNYFLRLFGQKTPPQRDVPIPQSIIRPIRITIPSVHLNRNIELVIYLPPSSQPEIGKRYPVLLFNDGQDLERMDMDTILHQAYLKKAMAPHLVVGIVAGDRIQEYGTESILDFLQRGSKAGVYFQFIRKELLPFLSKNYSASEMNHVHSIAGFSLGGLSALYLAWQYPKYFRRVGVFSGSLWWRSESFDNNHPDANLIMHGIVGNSEKRKCLNLWFQAGTRDEESDRNNNGIIDAIDDTLSLIRLLKDIGYTDEEVIYREVLDGEHNPDTWGKVMPEFLAWVGW